MNSNVKMHLKMKIKGTPFEKLELKVGFSILPGLRTKSPFFVSVYKLKNVKNVHCVITAE